jgi:nicotinamide-nucleotide amidase
VNIFILLYIKGKLMALVFIGREFKYKEFLQNYILKQYKTEEIYFFENLEFDLEKFIKKQNELVIIVNEKLYSTISKIIATLNDDVLEVKDEQLIPSKTIMYEKNSFLYQLDDVNINILKYENYLPPILLNKEYYKLHVFNYDKESVEIFVKPIFESFNINYIIYENEGGWCEIIVTSLNNMLLKQLKGFIPNIIVTDNIFEYIKEKLEINQKKITFAESCTGGLIASFLTKIPGSSRVFDGSVISYANEIKSKWLGVDKKVLNKFGAVSEETVLQMLLGILEISDSDYAIAVSGIAGPDGGNELKPVGTVFIGVSDNNGKFFVERLQLKGNREEIQYQAMMNAIRIFINFVNFL